MKRPANYQTKQREAILAYVASLENRHVTAAQIVGHFALDETSVGRTTVYRHLDRLTRDGQLQKCNVDGIPGACYQYVSEPEANNEHLLLKCEGCGELIHLDCGELDEMHRHIFQEHTFRVNAAKTVFYGKCGACCARVDGTGARVKQAHTKSTCGAHDGQNKHE